MTCYLHQCHPALPRHVRLRWKSGRHIFPRHHLQGQVEYIKQNIMMLLFSW